MNIYAPVDTARTDNSSLEKHGRLIFLFNKFVNVYSTRDVIAEILSRLKEYRFNPAEDAISLSGPSTLVALFAAAVSHKYGNFQALLYDPRLEIHHLCDVAFDSGSPGDSPGDSLSNSHETNEEELVEEESVEEPNYNV